jgi:catechol 2,3-dioxygenase-like lactoylglutathione lyase family enzyme
MRPFDGLNHNLRDYSAQAIPDARKTAMQQSLILARMAIKLNHTIVHSKDPRAAADFLARLFGLAAPKAFGPFLDVEVANEVTLAYLSAGDMEVQLQHYAFLVSDKEFDQIFGRIKQKKLKYWADPGQKQEGQINHHFDGRGVYFQDPSGHLMEIITKPYGSWDAI